MSAMGDGDMSTMGGMGDTPAGQMGDADDDSSADGETMEMPTDSDSTAKSGFSVLTLLMGIRSHWILVLIILAILDAGSIAMLVLVTKKEKARKAAELKALKAAAEARGEVHIVRTPKKESKHSHYLWIIALVVLVLLVVIVKVLTSVGGSSSGTQTEASTYSGQAELGEISTVLPGAGTLTEQDAEELSLADSVEITAWYVSNGDTVEEGDILAAVDQISVMTAIAEVQTQLTSLDEALAECEDQTVSSTITAAADARVIKIYAESGTSVLDTMYEHAALMLLSLDGYMAVSMDTNTEISAGDTVSVTLSDGTTVSGKVESMTNTTAVIVISDNGPTLGDVVSVETEDGTYVGEGVLYIHSELKVTGFIGSVSSISVSEGSSVSSGATLMTLTDTEYTGAYDLLLEQRSELEEQMEQLFKLYTDGYIYAPCSGVISGLDSSTTSATESTETSTEVSSASDTASATGTSTMATGSARVTKTAGTSATGSASVTKTASSSGYTVSTLSYGKSSTSVKAVALSSTTTESTDSDEAQESEEAAGTAESLFIGVASAITDEEIVVISLTGSSETRVSLSSELKVTYYDGSASDKSVSDVAVGDVLILSYTDGELSQMICICATTTSSSMQEEASGMGGQDTAGEEAKDTADSETAAMDNVEVMGEDAQESMGTEATTSLGGGDSAGSTTDMGTVTSSAAIEEELTTTYGVSTTTWLSITPQETVSITITVDEMDILSLSVGLEATVTLDAFPGQSFVGEVTAINQSGTNSGGSSKYTAEVTISREEGMLAGMNASAVIILSTEENVLCIPENALVEDGGSVYVYTTYDESSDTLGGLVEVTCGISDGTNVEILSGLEEGDDYYYSILDVVNYSSSYSSSGSGSFSINSLLGGSTGGMGGMGGR